MVDIVKTLNDCFRVYTNSLDLEQLQSAESEVAELLKKNSEATSRYKILTEDKERKFFALSLQLRAKILMLQYYDKGYYPDDGRTLIAFLSDNLPIASERGFSNTVVIFKHFFRKGN